MVRGILSERPCRADWVTRTGGAQLILITIAQALPHRPGVPGRGCGGGRICSLFG